MVEVTLEGYKYHYHKNEDGGYWIGVSGYKGSMGRYSNCRVPTMLWCGLRQKALEEGYSEEEFRVIPKESKAPKSRKSKAASNKKKKNSISIF